MSTAPAGVSAAARELRDPQDPVAMDAMTEALVRLGSRINVNAMQITLVGGILDEHMLEQAIREAAARFPMLLSRPDLLARNIVPGAWSPQDIPFEVAAYDASMTFASAAFRRFVAGLSWGNPIDWQIAPPVAFRLIRSAIGEARSCLLMTSSHAAADAQSDSMLLGFVIRRYGLLLSKGGGTAEEEPDHGFTSLRSLFPAAHSCSRELGAFALGCWSSGKEILRRDIGSPRPGARLIKGLDFYHEMLGSRWQERIHALAKASGHTINTVFAAALARVLARRAGWRAPFRKVRFACAFSLRRLCPSAAAQYRNLMVPCRLRVNSGSTSSLMRQVARQVQALKQGRIFVELAKVALVAFLLRRPCLQPLAEWLMGRIQGTVACYSNPGVMQESFGVFGHTDLPVLGYLGVGCVVPPLEFILYTPQVDGRLHLNAVYSSGSFSNFEREIILPLLAELERLWSASITKG